MIGRLLLLAVLLLACARAASVERIQPTFARAYNEWALINQAATPDTISAKEMIAWQKVKHEWRLLERKMDARYRGEVVYGTK